jgi:hypothetical protein
MDTGYLAFLWNRMDESYEWCHVLQEMLTHYQGDAPRYRYDLFSKRDLDFIIHTSKFILSFPLFNSISFSFTFGDDKMKSDMKWKEVFKETSHLFTPFVHKEFLNVQAVQSQQQIIDRESSVSYISALPKPQLEKFQQNVRSLLEKYDISGDKLFIPYITDLFHCQKQ